MQAAQQDSVLVEQVVYLASKARQATGQDPIFDLPKGKHSSSFCPIARALNLDCSVGGGKITFKDEAHAMAVAKACGLNLTSSGRSVQIPLGHPFQTFVVRYDSRTSKTLNVFAL